MRNKQEHDSIELFGPCCRASVYLPLLPGLYVSENNFNFMFA